MLTNAFSTSSSYSIYSSKSTTPSSESAFFIFRVDLLLSPTSSSLMINSGIYAKSRYTYGLAGPSELCLFQFSYSVNFYILSRYSYILRLFDSFIYCSFLIYWFPISSKPETLFILLKLLVLASFLIFLTSCSAFCVFS